MVTTTLLFCGLRSAGLSGSLARRNVTVKPLQCGVKICGKSRLVHKSFSHLFFDCGDGYWQVSETLLVVTQSMFPCTRQVSIVRT